MASLFQGDPQKATSYVNTTQDSPKWMQDAIYNQIQLATNTANRPYQAFEDLNAQQQQGYLDKTYQLPRVAELSPLQQQAYQQVQDNVGAWKQEMDFASKGMQGFSTKGTADQLRGDQAQYLRQGDIASNLDAASNIYGRAGGISPFQAASPYLSQSQQTTAQALADRALTAANPYLQSASQSSAANINQYMSPYQQGVLDVIARQGARNLSENLLPGVSDAFIRAGQFGSNRMGEFGSRALRDTQEAVLNQQANALQQGYTQALGASQADLARQAQLAGTVGSISGADLSRILQGAGQYQNIGQTAGQLSSQEMQNLINLGQARTTAGQAQQQFGLNAAQATQAAQAADYQRQMAALTSVADMARQAQGMRTADAAALESAGMAQQAQQQRELDAARAQFGEAQGLFNAEREAPKQALDWLSTQVRGMAPIVPTSTTETGTSTGQTYSPSPLSQLASSAFAYKGLTS